MSGELDKICSMLEDSTPELQCAAAMVLGELKPKEPAVRKALVKAIKAGIDSVRLYAAEALAKIDPEGGLPHLVPLLAGSEEARGRVTEILKTQGAAASKALREQLETKDAGLRRRVLEALGQLPEVDASDALFAGLLDPDLDVVREAAQSFRRRLEGLPAAGKSKALNGILDFMGSARVKKVKTPLASCLSIVGALRDPAGIPTILSHLDRKQPPAARSAALAALSAMPLENAKGVGTKLLPLLEESDFNSIVKPALDVLGKLSLGREETPRLLKLLKSPHVHVRYFAMKSLGSIGSSAASLPLVEALLGDDTALAEAAGGSLAANPEAAPALVKALGRQKDLPRLWRIANVLRSYRSALGKPVLRAFADRAVDLVAKREAPFQVYFEIVRAADPAFLKETFLKRGEALLAKKKFDEAEVLLKLLQTGDLATSESDYALATAQLHRQRRDLGSAGRDFGPAVSLFTALARREDFPLLKRLQKDAARVGAAELLYLGFALIERQGAERDAGADILRLVAKKHGSKEEGKTAKQKLKTQGI